MRRGEFDPSVKDYANRRLIGPSGRGSYGIRERILYNRVIIYILFTGSDEFSGIFQSTIHQTLLLQENGNVFQLSALV